MAPARLRGQGSGLRVWLMREADMAVSPASRAQGLEACRRVADMVGSLGSKVWG